MGDIFCTVIGDFTVKNLARICSFFCRKETFPVFTTRGLGTELLASYELLCLIVRLWTRNCYGMFDCWDDIYLTYILR